jgi:hypothetical protein
MVNREYTVRKPNYNIQVDEGLLKKINDYKIFRQHKNRSQAAAELINAGLEYLKEQAEDEYLLALALEREENGSGKTYSEEEILRKYGITEEDLENGEDVETAAKRNK